MQFKRFTLENCHEIVGTAVVIDVLRAFTTAAFAFNRGVEKINLVATIEEAFQLKEKQRHALLIGEEGGLPIDGFDFGNSPARMATAHLQGKTVIQRTSSGTPGVVGCVNADLLLTSSFVCAQATVDYLSRVQPATVSFVITGSRQDRVADEDVALADYVQALLQNESPDPEPFLQRVRDSRNGRIFLSPAHHPQELDHGDAHDRGHFVVNDFECFFIGVGDTAVRKAQGLACVAQPADGRMAHSIGQRFDFFIRQCEE